MTVEEAYRVYISLRLHFTSEKFDIRKGVYPKIPKAGIKTAFRTKLEQLLRKYNYDAQTMIEFFVSNFLQGESWGGLFDAAGHETYMEWRKNHERLTYMYTEDVAFLSYEVTDIEQLWDCSNGHPIVLKALLGKKITLETLVILNKLYKYRTHVDEQLPNDPAWSNVSRLIDKYSPFVHINKDKYQMITKKAFNG